MRKIASFSSKGEADRFRWILYSYHISSLFDSDEQTAGDIWIMSEDDIDQANHILQTYRQNPAAPEFHQQAEQGKKALALDQKKEKASVRRRPKQEGLFSQLPVTLSLIGFSCLIFLLSYGFGGGSNQLKATVIGLLRFSLFSGHDFFEIRQGQVWRLISPIFLHGDIFHIFFNMMWLWILGQQVESLGSSRQLILLTICIAIPSHLAFYLVAGPAFGGMSGVNYGLFSYLWFMDRYGHSSYRAEGNLSQFFLVWYVLCLVLTFFGFHIANSIHGVGALMGFVYAYFSSGKYKQTKQLIKFNRNFTNHLLIGLGLLLAGLVVDYLSYQRLTF